MAVQPAVAKEWRERTGAPILQGYGLTETSPAAVVNRIGDEFTGDSIDRVVNTVDRYNEEDENGERLVRIHGVGFPVMFSRIGFQENTGVRFATLMRLLCRNNGGAFVGLSSIRR